MSEITDFLSRMPVVPPGPAERMYEKLVRSIAQFEEKLNDTQEVGARLINFGSETIHIEDVGFWGHELVKFYGTTSDGRPVELLQHVSQISVLLVALPIQPNKQPRRIGFELVKDLEKKEH
jgi:hypothetical protein